MNDGMFVADQSHSLEAPVVICEIGCNHKGDMKTALEMIRVASQFCNVDVIKFQKRTNSELLSPEEYGKAHPNRINAFGDTYGAHREFLEFDLEQHRTLKESCEEWGAIYSTSVWDQTSAREIISLNPKLIKVPSAINTDERVLEILFSEYGGEVHISLGMTTRKEEDRIIELANHYNRLKDTTIYHCISGYPVPAEDLCLLELRRLITDYGNQIGHVGFSGHHTGISADIAALTLGAECFERHFTLDRTWKGTDHSASLEPDGLRRLCRDLKIVTKSLQPMSAEISEIENEQRNKLKKFSTITERKIEI